MKKVLIATMTVLMLSGCGDVEKRELPTTLTKIEQGMLQIVYDKYSDSTYNIALSTIGFQRTNPIEREVPFCDVIGLIEKAETKWSGKALRSGVSILSQWKNLKNESLRESCDRMNGVVSKSYKKEVETQTVSVSTKTKVLSPEMYRNLIDAAKTCKRAEIAAIDLVSNQRLLTEDDYTQVNTIIAECQSYQLEKVLNEK